MRARNEDALICDFAEYYHVLDYMGLPLRLAATLAAGLPASSRIKLELAGQKYPTETMLMMAILDGIRINLWMQTEDGHKNRNRPKSVLEDMTKEKEQYANFASIAEYEAARQERIKNG